MYGKWSEQEYPLSKRSKLSTKVFHIFKVYVILKHMLCILDLEITKFVSAKKSVEKTEVEGTEARRIWQGGRAKFGKESTQGTEYCWICQCGGLELSRWIVQGERQLTAGRAKGEYGKPSTPVIMRLGVRVAVHSLVGIPEKGNFSTLPTIAKC